MAVYYNTTIKMYYSIHLAAIGVPWAPQWQLSNDYVEKANLGNTKENDTKTRKVHADGNNHCPVKEWRLYA